MKLPLLLLPNNTVFTLWISVKINAITNLTHNLNSKNDSSTCEINFCYLFRCRWRVLPFFTTSVLAMLLTSVTAFLNVHARIWLPTQRIHSCLSIVPTFWIIPRVVSSLNWSVPLASVRFEILVRAIIWEKRIFQFLIVAPCVYIYSL